MTTADIAASLRCLAALRLSQGMQLRARCLAASAFEVEELSDAELALVGIGSQVTA